MIHPRIMAAGRRAIPTIRPLRRNEASNRRPVWTTDGDSAQVLAFYPADWSPVCGDQMALYNEVLPEFHKHDAEVLGISVDGAWCHEAFAKDRTRFTQLPSGKRPGHTKSPVHEETCFFLSQLLQKATRADLVSFKAFKLPHLRFPLLADFHPKGAAAKGYGAYREGEGVCERALFVIDRQGITFWSYCSPIAVNPGADGILDALERLPKQGTSDGHVKSSSHAA
jgi:peroxiredoxin